MVIAHSGTYDWVAGEISIVPSSLVLLLVLLSRSGRTVRFDFLLGSISPSVNLRDGPGCGAFKGAGVVLVRRKVWARRFALEPFGSRDVQKSLETDMSE